MTSGGLGVQGRDALMWDAATSGSSLVSLLRCSAGDLGAASEGAGGATTVGACPRAPMTLSRWRLGDGRRTGMVTGTRRRWDRDCSYSHVRRRGQEAQRGRAHHELLFCLLRQLGRGDLGHQRDPGEGEEGMSTHGIHRSQEGPSPCGDVGGSLTGSPLAPVSPLLPGAPGSPWRWKERRGKKKMFNTRLMSKGSPEPHPARPLSRRGDAHHVLASSTILHSQGLEGTGDARGDISRWDSNLLEQKKGSDPRKRWMEVSRDTYAVTLGTGGTAGTLGSGGTTGTGEAGSASNARSTLEEADEVVREQHGPSSQSQEGGKGHSRLRPWHQVDHQHRGCPVERKRRRRVMLGLAGHEAKGQGVWDATYSRTSSASRAGGTGLTAGTLGTFTATSSLGTSFTLGRKRREEEP